MIDIKMEEHLAPLGIIPRSYVLALIPLFIYMLYKVSPQSKGQLELLPF